MTDEALAELDRKIAVMQASKTQQIQFREDHCGEWNDMKGECPSWDWDHNDYRVKPAEPICLSLMRMDNGEYSGGRHTFKGRTEPYISFIELTPEVRTKLTL